MLLYRIDEGEGKYNCQNRPHGEHVVIEMLNVLSDQVSTDLILVGQSDLNS